MTVIRAHLKRETGLLGAVLLGLGSMLGSGVFVSIGLAEHMVGPYVLPAILLAALVAGCNALSSAQLAASHAWAGGTYEYGHVFLSPSAGFAAGTMFLLAKSASAATAALAFAAYLQALTGAPLPLVAAACGLVAMLTVLVLNGLKRANWLNALLVGGVVAVLLIFVASGSFSDGPVPALQPGAFRAPDFLHASALLFVAFTGYGRVATLAEEVQEPRRTIPLAIGATILTTTVLYLGVGYVLARHGSGSDGATPLEGAATIFASSWLVRAVAAAALLAMAGVLLNLLLGLSRVLLAMGRRGDAPTLLAGLRGGEPVAAIVAVAIAISALCLVGDVRVAWTFSAATVLIYYAITNLAALKLAGDERLFPRWIALTGLAGCAGLAAFVPAMYWRWAAAALAAAFLLSGILRRRVDGRAAGE